MRSRTGFTVLEAAVALLIVGVAAIGVLQAFAGHARSARTARDAAELSVVASDVLARIRVLPPHALSPLPDSLARGWARAPLDRMEWRARVRPSGRERFLFDVVVEVVRGDASFELHTLRYAPPAILAGTP